MTRCCIGARHRWFRDLLDPQHRAHEVHGAIYAQWASLGWERSGLGYPITDEYAIPGGRGNDFVHGTITWQASTNTTQTTYR